MGKAPMKAIARVLDMADNGLAVQESTTLTPGQMLERFMQYIDVLEQTSRAYRYGVQYFIEYLKSENISRPTRESVLDYKKALMAKGLKPSTIALYLSSLRRFFSWCESEGLYANITLGVKSPKQQAGHKRDFLSGKQIAGMLSQARSKRDYAMMLLIASCGLRTVEVTRANIGDIRALGDTTVLYVCGKGRTSKTEFVKLSEPVYKALQEYLLERGQVSENDPLFVSASRRNKGQRLTTRTVSGICKSSMKRAGYDSIRLTAHSLRHSAATLALLGGADLVEVQHFLRHSSIGVTQVYLHSVNRMKSLCEQRVTDAIFAA